MRATWESNANIMNFKAMMLFICINFYQLAFSKMKALYSRKDTLCCNILCYNWIGFKQIFKLANFCSGHILNTSICTFELERKADILSHIYLELFKSINYKPKSSLKKFRRRERKTHILL